MSSLDKNTIYLFRSSFGPSEIPEWKQDQFPEVKYDEYVYLKSALTRTEAMGYQIFTRNESIKYEEKIATGVNVVPVSQEFEIIQRLEFGSGRFYNESEANSGASVVVLGFETAKLLFDDFDPIGKNVRLYGQRFTVIGVLKKIGGDSFGGSDDTSAFVPVNFVRRLYGDNNQGLTNVILIKPEKGVDMESYKSELTQKLRNFRGMKDGEIDNFFINVLSGFTDFLDGIISQMNIVGWVIAAFSLLVGGFGIANIMFVSVKERTNLIGIQKSLGAKNKFILFQFLFEAVILCLMGGMVGIIFVWIISIILTNALEFEFILGYKNVFLGTGLAAFIGVISGILPALSASKLDPVEAIRSGM